MANIVQNGDFYWVKAWFQAGEQVAVNTIWYRIADMAGIITDVDLLNHIIGVAAWPTAWKALLSDDAIYRGFQMGRAYPKPPTRPNHTIVGAGSGSVVGEILPRQVSGIISFQTDFAGPKFRGRLYIPFPSEASSEAVLGTPVASYVTALDTLAALLVAGFAVAPGGGNSCTMAHVIYHRDNEPPTYDLVREGFGREKWATQKRRGSYGQPNVAPF